MEVHLTCFIIHGLGIIPLSVAWNAQKCTTLRHAILWTITAWAGWGVVLLEQIFPTPTFSASITYLALCLSSCAGMAVLGARRPGAGAWNFVVCGLLAVLLLPIAEGFGEVHPTLLWFLGATLLIIPVNYGLTRLGVPALMLSLALVMPMLFLFGTDSTQGRLWEIVSMSWPLMMSLSPWIAWALVSWQSRSHTEFDRVWVSFRNSFGMIWALRIRDQFNRSAANSGQVYCLRWSGLQSRGLSQSPESPAPQALVTLRALLRRFDGGI
jgi:hypothetical protein